MMARYSWCTRTMSGFSYIDTDDVEEIIQEHLVHGRVVERLKI